MNDDVEYLKNLPKNWWKSPDTVLLVGRTLDNYGYIKDPWHFMEKPQHYQTLIDEFVRDWKDG